MLHVTIDASMLTGKPANSTCEIAVNIAGCAWEKKDPPELPTFANESDLRKALFPWEWKRPTKLILRWLNDAKAPIAGAQDLEFTISPDDYVDFEADRDEVIKHYNLILENKIIRRDDRWNVERDAAGNLVLNPLELQGEFAPGKEILQVNLNDETSDPALPPLLTHFYSSTIAQFAQYLAPLNVKSRLTFFASKNGVEAPQGAKHYFLYPVCDQQDNRWGGYPTPPDGVVDGESAEIIYKLNDEPTMFLHSRIEEIPLAAEVKMGPTELRDSNGNFRGHTELEVSDSDELFDKHTFREKIIRSTARTFDLAGWLYEFLNSDEQRVKIVAMPADVLPDWSSRINELFLSLFRDRYSLGNPVNQKHTEAILGFDKAGSSLGTAGVIHSYTADIRNPNDYVSLVPADVHAKIEAFDAEFLPDTWFEFLNDVTSPSLTAALRRAAQYVPTSDEISVARWLELWRMIVAHAVQPESKSPTDEEKSSRQEQLTIIEEKRALVKLQIVRAVAAYIYDLTEPKPTATDEEKKKLELLRESSLRLFAVVADKDFQLLDLGDLLLESIGIDIARDPSQVQFDSAKKDAVKTVLKAFRVSHVKARAEVRLFPSLAAILTAIADLNLSDSDLGSNLWQTFAAFVSDPDVEVSSIFGIDFADEVDKLIGAPTDVPPNVLIKVDDVDPGVVAPGAPKEDDLADEIAGYAVMMQRGNVQFADDHGFANWRGLNWSRVDLLTKARGAATEPFESGESISLGENYFIPSYLPEELIDEIEQDENNAVGTQAANSIKNAFLTLTNERLSLPAGHDLYEEIEEVDPKETELRKYLFQYLFENGPVNARKAVPAAYALWYGFHHNFAGFVVLNSGVLPEALRAERNDWLIPKVQIPDAEIKHKAPYHHLRRV
ncbi:MAG: hypothetical protein ACT4O9_01300 [Blastocatellia bacterium]